MIFGQGVCSEWGDVSALAVERYLPRRDTCPSPTTASVSCGCACSSVSCRVRHGLRRCGRQGCCDVRLARRHGRAGWCFSGGRQLCSAVFDVPYSGKLRSGEHIPLPGWPSCLSSWLVGRLSAHVCLCVYACVCVFRASACCWAVGQPTRQLCQSVSRSNSRSLKNSGVFLESSQSVSQSVNRPLLVAVQAL